jgi:arylsulfatase A-like enzyme/Tfp pilus assembly protein PilF
VRQRAFFIVAILLLSCSKEAVRVSAPKSDDIILITIDTLRADSTGFAGNPRVKTPFLDRIASEGITFSNAHAHNVVTLASHTNILTGLYPYQHGVRDNSGFKLDPKHESVATMLGRGGYTTGAFVGAFPLDSRFGLNQGFAVYDDNYGKGSQSLDFALQERPATAVLDSATRWWNANSGKKRFMWVHVYDPHAPYRPPEPFATDYASDRYLGEIAYVDDALGKAIAPLLSDSTLLIVTSDHGEGRGEHGELTHGLFAYEATLKVPLLVWRSGLTHRVEPGYVRHIDIVPTILQSAGISRPATLLGVSLFEGIGSRDSYFESLSTSLNRGWAPLKGVIHRQEKYIDLPLAELYDLPRDPREQNNILEQKRRDVAEARRVLATFPWDQNINPAAVSAEEAARLRSLGYLGGGAELKKTYTAPDDPKNLVGIDSRIHEAIDAYEQHDLAKAAAIAQQVVSQQPTMSVGRELLAFVQQQQERIPEAIANLREAVKTGGQSPRVQLGLLLTESGRAAEAAQILAPLVRGEDPDVLNAYGIALADEGKLDDAARQFESVLKKDPNNAPALQNLGVVALRRGDVHGAEQYLTQALNLNPNLPMALNTLGVVYARAGDYPRAIRSWQRAVDIDPRQYDALYNIGFVEGRAGHLAEARAALTRFMKTAPRERYAADIATAKKALASLP